MNPERLGPERESLGKEVRRLLPQIVADIKRAAEKNSVFSQDIKQRVYAATNITAEAALTHLLDNSTRYSYLHGTEKRLRYMLGYHITDGVGRYLMANRLSAESEGLPDFLRRHVLSLSEWKDWPPDEGPNGDVN